MRNIAFGMLIGALLVAAFSFGVVQAQNPALTSAVGELGVHGMLTQNPALTPYQITESSKCIGNMDTSATGQAIFCFGSDGAFISMNGAAPVQFAPTAAVASPVLSVNGKTGAVVLAIQ